MSLAIKESHAIKELRSINVSQAIREPRCVP